MKKIGLMVVLAVISSALGLTACSHRSQAARVARTEQARDEKMNDDASFAAREETTQNFQLAADARVEVHGINGSVDVQTSDGTTAEVYVLRLARNKEAFEKSKVKISFQENTLQIEGNRREGGFGIWDHLTGNDELRTRVTLKVPHKINFTTTGVNGRVNVGDLEGRFEAHGVNGKVVVAKATGSTEFTGINGKIEATIARLDKHGIGIHGVNGNVDLKFLDEVNAEVEMHGSNGRVKAELPNVKVAEEKRGRYLATIGTGGPMIEMSGSNGNLWLGRAGAPAAKTAETASSAAPKPQVKGS